MKRLAALLLAALAGCSQVEYPSQPEPVSHQVNVEDAFSGSEAAEQYWTVGLPEPEPPHRWQFGARRF